MISKLSHSAEQMSLKMKKLTLKTLVLSSTVAMMLMFNHAAANVTVENLQPTTEMQASLAKPKGAEHLAVGVLADSTATALAQSTAINQSYQSTAWFQTIDLTLKQDRNDNGFYSRLYVRFDANSEYTRQPAYAVYSLIGSGGYETIIYTSSIFDIFGSSTQDWFAIDSDLKSLPRGLYKLRIQLKDAQTGYTLAEISGYDTASLDRMALEDTSSDSAIIYVEESGGSIGILSLLGLSLLYLGRRKTPCEKGSTTLA